MRLPLDLLYNLRLLRKNLGFVAICVLMIGAGIGLSISLYTIGDNLGTKPLPFPDGDRFVTVLTVDESTSTRLVRTLDAYNFHSLQQSATSFKTFGAEQSFMASFSDGDVATRYRAVRISSNLLQASEVVPLMGRSLQPGDDVVGAPAVALISYELWQNYYTGREDIIGTNSRINGNSHTIVGVLPQGFHYPMSQHAWIPLQLSANAHPGEVPGLIGTGILAEGVSIESARAEIGTLLQGLADDLPDFYSDLAPRVNMCCGALTSGEGGASMVGFLFTTLTVALLLLVSLNVANLILVRTNQRLHEFSIRSALGASRKRLVFAVLQDSLLICLLGAVLGLGLADIGMSYITSAATVAMSGIGELPFWFDFDWKLGTAVTALVIVVAIWLLSVGLAIWQIMRQDLATTLAGGKSAASDNRSALGTATMVSIEIVFSCFLLVICGVLMGASNDLADTEYGTATEGYLTGQIFLDNGNYNDAGLRERYRRELQRELTGIEGIEEISFTSDLPSLSRNRLYFDLEERDLRVNNEYPRQRIIHVAENYFDTMDVSLLAGRQFETTDSLDSQQVVIIDELFAQQIWAEAADPRQAALGKRIQLDPETENAKWVTIVGVISQIVQAYALEGVEETAFFLPYAQPCCTDWRPISVVLKVSGDPYNYRRALQEAAMRVDRDIAIASIVPLDEFLESANSILFFGVEMSTTIAFTTLLLAITGIFAIVSRSVRQRMKEIGIRRAVGASNQHILWVFIRQGYRYLGLGLLIGGGGAILVVNALSSDALGVLDWLPLAFTSVSLTLIILVLVATLSPARTLIAMEPGETLRDE